MAPYISSLSRQFCGLLLGLFFLEFLGGCAVITAYVDPAMRTVEYDGLKRPAQPRPIMLTVQFQANGKPKPVVDAQARAAVVKTLEKSGIFTPVTGDGGEQLTITINNVGDFGKANVPAFLSGMVNGWVPVSAVDKYVMSVKYQRPGGPVMSKEYYNAIASSIGNFVVSSTDVNKPPNYLRMRDLNAAFERIVEDMTLAMLADLQREP